MKRTLDMSIAQSSVAGEGQSHLDDCDALYAYQAESVNLPWIIFRAAFRASRTEQLSTRARSMLAALARTVDASKPYAAIYARRELLTGRAMVSMRTLYRSLDDLENAGLIERRAQSRYVEAGLFGRAYLHLTERAAILLGLVDPARTDLALDADEATNHSKTSSDVPLTPPSATVADGVIYKDLYPDSFQKRQPGQVPGELQRLRTLGFFDFLIFKLMREAREQGKRLSDVVEATWDHLKLAKAPINYLRTLLRNPVDFSHLVRRRVEAEADQATREGLQAQAVQAAQEHAGKSFIDANGQRRYFIEPDGKSMTITSAGEGVARQAVNWMQPFAAALCSAKIRLATTADLEAFAATCRKGITADVPTMAIKRQPTYASASAQQRPPVTREVRAHIASLRRLLQPRAMAT
jgi:DNA-binding transcriptional ArsR family regulator